MEEDSRTALAHAVEVEDRFLERTDFPDRKEWSEYFRAAHHANIPPKESKEFYETLKKKQ